MITISKICEQCHETFLVRASKDRFKPIKFCSPECYHASVAPQYVTTQCAYCKKSFALKDWQFAARSREAERLYCSRKCRAACPEWRALLGASLKESERAKAQREHATAAMIAASRKPEERAARAQRARDIKNDPEQYARWIAGIKKRSDSEEWKNSPQFQKGAAHPNYQGGKTARREGMSRYRYKKWRALVVQRDGATCQRCGYTEGEMHAHHIQDWDAFPDLRYEVSNGMTLCLRCHNELHGKVPREKFKQCVDCGKSKKDGRCPRCRSCGAKHALQC